MDKPRTVSSGPIVATERDVEQAAAIIALLVAPIPILPQMPAIPTFEKALPPPS